MGIDASEYQRLSARYALNGVLGSWHYPVLGLAEEAGEVLGKVAKAIRDSNGKIDYEAVKKELGDVLWMAAGCCTAFGFDMSDVMQGNLEKLESRLQRGAISGSGDDR